MAGKSDWLENAILALIFNATAISKIADNAATTPLTNLYVSLHTADPTDAGSQTSNETAYTGYARVAVARTSGGWTISGTSPTQVVPAAAITFGSCTASPGAACTYAAIGDAATGAGHILYAGALSPSIQPAVGVQPVIGTGSTITED